MFAGVYLPQCSLLWGQTWWDNCTWRALSGHTINDIHDQPGAKATGGQSGDWTDSDAGPPVYLEWI